MESWVKPLIDLTVKEGKEKTAKFEGEFSKKDSKPKWFFKKDVSLGLNVFVFSFYDFVTSCGFMEMFVVKEEWMYFFLSLIG